jgi:hypothetical protein
MNENYEQPSDVTFTCDFGTLTLDTPFAQQPSLQRFLNVQTFEEGRFISDELLRRFLAISECVINQELANSSPRQFLTELHVGYELWKASPPDDDGAIKPGDLIEYRWLNQNGIDDIRPAHQHPSSTLLNQVTERLMERCQENARQRLDTNFLVGKSLGVFVYGTTRQVGLGVVEALAQKTFGSRGCECEGMRRQGTDCERACP